MTPYCYTELHDMGYLTAAMIGKKFGLPNFTFAFISLELGIPPDASPKNNNGYFWNPDSQERIRKALIQRLENIK